MIKQISRRRRRHALTFAALPWSAVELFKHLIPPTAEKMTWFGGIFFIIVWLLLTLDMNQWLWPNHKIAQIKSAKGLLKSRNQYSTVALSLIKMRQMKQKHYVPLWFKLLPGSLSLWVLWASNFLTEGMWRCQPADISWEQLLHCDGTKTELPFT